MHDASVSVIVGVFAVVGIIVMWLARKGYPVIRAAVHLAELITGTPEKGDIKRVPGLAERLGNIDKRMANVEYELKTNSGGSLRDLVTETKNLAVQNASDAKDAKVKAEQAAALAAGVADALTSSEEKASRERHVQAQALDGLLSGLESFASEAHSKEVAVLRAFKGIGIDLPEIVDEL